MRQALELALEALEGFIPYLPLKDEAQCNRYDKAITAIKEALAQPEQEPMAWMNDSTPSGIFARHMEGAKNFGCTIPLYTTPPQRTWVGLTDEEIADCAEKMEASDPTDSFWREFFRGIEAKLKDKNT
jgi:hypothetical protein